jgi:hypothetical protein
MNAALGTPAHRWHELRGGHGVTVPQFATRVHAVISRPKSAQAQQDGDEQEAAGDRRRGSPLLLLRHHWLFMALLAAGLVLRVLTMVAYRPALFYIDSTKYLFNLWPGADPVGYKVVLKSVLAVSDLSAVVALQHLAGLAMAVTLYVVLLRRGAWRWLAALSAAPVLLDAYQLQMEHTIMPDMWFEVLIVAGLAVLLWRPAVSLRAAILAGLILGASATVRQVGEVLVLPALVWLLIAAGGWRQALTRSIALIAAFAVPIVAYCSISLYNTGHFWLASQGPDSALGRLAEAVDCSTLKASPAVHAMCPTPAEQAKGIDWLEHDATSPLHAPAVPHGVTRKELISEFKTAVEHQQPLRVVGGIFRDSARLFALNRTQEPGITPISRWQFHIRYPQFSPEIKVKHGTIYYGQQTRAYQPFHDVKLNNSYGNHAAVSRPLATFLRSYQLDGGYTPGPLFALATLAGLAGSLLALRRRADARSRQITTACLLFTVTGVAVLLMSDLFEFSWRYQLPGLVTLPAAGALGITAVFGLRSRRQQAAAQPGSAAPVAAGPAPAPPAAAEPAANGSAAAEAPAANGSAPAEASANGSAPGEPAEPAESTVHGTSDQ